MRARVKRGGSYHTSERKLIQSGANIMLYDLLAAIYNQRKVPGCDVYLANSFFADPCKKGVFPMPDLYAPASGEYAPSPVRAHFCRRYLLHSVYRCIFVNSDLCSCVSHFSFYLTVLPRCVKQFSLLGVFDTCSLMSLSATLPT